MLTAFSEELGEWAAVQILGMRRSEPYLEVVELDWSAPQPPGTVDRIAAQDGLRPVGEAVLVPWVVPRSHIVRDHVKDGHSGLLSIVGGKLTTYRQLAEDAVDKAVKILRAGLKHPVSRLQPFPGARAADMVEFEAWVLSTTLVRRDTAERLGALYGTRAERVRVSTHQAVKRKKRASMRYAAMTMTPNSKMITWRSMAASACSTSRTPAATMATAPHRAAAGRSRCRKRSQPTEIDR